jgi:iron-sulfur cluster assembly protein
VDKVEGFTVLTEALNRILEIRKKDRNEGKFLRIKVLGGGCSGFQYNFNLDDNLDVEDFKIEEGDDVIIAIDQTSLEFLKGCSIDFVNNLGGSYFKINNPSATANCGCGNSFAI